MSKAPGRDVAVVSRGNASGLAVAIIACALCPDRQPPLAATSRWPQQRGTLPTAWPARAVRHVHVGLSRAHSVGGSGFAGSSSTISARLSTCVPGCAHT